MINDRSVLLAECTAYWEVIKWYQIRSVTTIDDNSTTMID